jgi:O-antigen/teichoic acid export membrane protein
MNVAGSLLGQYLLSRTILKSFGLPIGYMFGTLVAMVLLFWKNRNVVSLNVPLRSVLSDVKEVLVRYKKFPMFNLPATFVNLFANQIPQLMLNFFGQSTVGQFSLSQRVLGSPVTLFSTSVSHVFKERASSDYRIKGSCRGIFVQTLKSLFLISIIPFLLLFILSPTLVPIIFGEEWRTAGIYIRALSLMYFFKFTVSPLSYVIIIAEKQNLNLVLQIIFLVLTSGALYIGVRSGNALTAITLYSIAYAIVYLLFLITSYRLTENDKKTS